MMDTPTTVLVVSLALCGIAEICLGSLVYFRIKKGESLEL